MFEVNGGKGGGGLGVRGRFVCEAYEKDVRRIMGAVVTCTGD
jgi:hypothetical protein